MKEASVQMGGDVPDDQMWTDPKIELKSTQDILGEIVMLIYQSLRFSIWSTGSNFRCGRRFALTKTD